MPHEASYPLASTPPALLKAPGLPLPGHYT